MKLLIIEDEKALCESIKSYFEDDGYICETSFNFEQAQEKINLYEYDCIIVDLNIPGGSGLNIIKELKQIQSLAGIIIISAKNALDDKLEGLDIGADDYLTKPFHLSELNARVKSILRRRSFSGRNVIEFNEIKIVPDESTAYVNEQPLSLTKKEYDLLLYFLSNKKHVVTKESIAEHLWGDNIDMADSYDFVYTHIKNLRKKIIEKGGNDYIKTVYGMGYKFAEL